jgi:hypothetical protein
VSAPGLNQRSRRVGLWGHPLVDYPMFCTTTRVRVRAPWTLLRAWWHFRIVSREARAIPAIKRMAFLVEGPRTFVILSVWDGEQGMRDFATRVDMHHVSVRMCFAQAAFTGDRAEIWSAQWRMWSASNNLSWDGHEDFAALVPPPSNGEVRDDIAPVGDVVS